MIVQCYHQVKEKEKMGGASEKKETKLAKLKLLFT